jgi:GTP:adenosylcobinamide-phosphate guanylyltransferase
MDSNHKGLISLMDQDFDTVVGIKKAKSALEIRKNYSVEIKDGRVKSLMEKPEKIINEYVGCGTYVFSPGIFRHIEEMSRAGSAKIELAEVIDRMAKSSVVLPFLIEGSYMNINTLEDLNYANYMWKDMNFERYKVTVIIPAYNEEKTIAEVVEDYKSSRHVDEVVVIDTNSTDKTDRIAREHGANVLTRSGPLSGYGEKLKYAMSRTKNDIIILTEADGSFRAKDIPKLLEYMKDADMVIGTRTTRQMVEQGANMDWFLRWGNVFLGKVVEALWWKQEPRFTDVGCTYRAIWKDAFNQIKDSLHAKGPEFSPEMMVEILKAKKRVVEIPVSYYRRGGGESKHSKGKLRSLKTGLRMLSLIVRKWGG